ncbi:MAG: superoxide dismutase [Candidatus Pacebacteria bacterium]|nr:superoxide dismutase [Candidatus Paceibacterota bacterium]
MNNKLHLDNKGVYRLPDLHYNYNALDPYISAEQLKIHYQKHHLNYVKNANRILRQLEEKRRKKDLKEYKCYVKNLSFELGGHILHSLFWSNLTSPDKGGEPEGKLKSLFKKRFGGFRQFKDEFSAAALSVEGSGWAVLSYDPESRRPLIMQIEKHNVNFPPGNILLLVLDMWEHAYYIDYKNEKDRFVEGFWSIVSWEEVEKRIRYCI